MRIAFIIPVLNEINLKETYDKITEACEIEHDIIFAINGKLNSFFAEVRTTFLSESHVKAFMVDRPVNEHKLITLGMEMTEDYDATIIYSGKEIPNVDVIKAFIASWKAGNRIVYLKKEYSGFKKLWVKLKRGLYSLGIKFLGIFKDYCAETDIQLIDQDVVKTINQLPQKNRQLRVLDSFVGFQSDIIQLEIDNKVKDNKLYEDKSKSYKISGLLSLSCILIAFASIIMAVLGICLDWNLSALLYILLFLIGATGTILSYIFFTKRLLHFRVGDLVDINELNDLRNKIEKYNIINKNSL
jgi:dolichol-phosphate mannosyltransferase